MPIKRKKFFIIGNFQLKFIFCFVMVLAIGILLTGSLIYNLAFHIIEGTAFSAHLSVASSGEMLRDVILKMNFVVGCTSVLIGALIIVGTHLYLKKYFRHLIAGFDQLSRHNFSFRMDVKRYSAGKYLMGEFNSVAQDLQSKSDEIRVAISQAAKAIHSDDQEGYKICQTLNRSVRKLLVDKN